MNTVVINGRLIQAPEVRYTPRGSRLTVITIAHNEYWSNDEGEKQESSFLLRIEAWGKLGENAEKFLVKGQMVHITGKLIVTSAKVSTPHAGDVTHYYTKVTATGIDFGAQPKEKVEEGAAEEAPF